MRCRVNVLGLDLVPWYYCILAPRARVLDLLIDFITHDIHIVILSKANGHYLRAEIPH